MAKNIKTGLFDTFGTGVILDSKVVLRHPFPSVADASITRIVRNLTSSEEEQLTKVSRQCRDDIFDRFNKVEQQVLEKSKITDSNMLAFTVCSACGYDLQAIKNRTISRFLSRSDIAGLICSNQKCSFYLKLIPANKIPELTNVGFIQQITLATENFFKRASGISKKVV